VSNVAKGSPHQQISQIRQRLYGTADEITKTCMARPDKAPQYPQQDNAADDIAGPHMQEIRHAGLFFGAKICNGAGHDERQCPKRTTGSHTETMPIDRVVVAIASLLAIIHLAHRNQEGYRASSALRLI